MGDLRNLPVANDDVRFLAQDGRNQVRHVAAGVLVIGVGVNNNVGPQAQGGVEAGLERLGQSQVARVVDDVGDAESLGGYGRSIRAPVIHHQRLDTVNARNMRRQPGQRFRQRGRFVVAGNLNN